MSGINLVGDNAVRVWIYCRVRQPGFRPASPVTTSRLQRRQSYLIVRHPVSVK